MEAKYDDTQLQKLFADLEVKERVKALKGGFRREANQVRKTAINNLRSSGINTDTDLEDGIRAVVFTRAAGFKVTIAPGKKGGKTFGLHETRQYLKRPTYYRKLPILVFAEGGTEMRRTKSNSGKHTKMWVKRKRAGHNTGRMRAYGFMKQTLRDVRDTVTANLHNEVILSVEKVAKKNGCI
jgi:hypothetical protein